MPSTKEAAFAFEKETEIHGELHLHSSGPMLSQSILSRKGDLYFPASPDYMAKASRGSLIESLKNKKRYRKLFPLFGFRHTSIIGEPPYFS
jgi:ABC-type molybdate transport system substrate-binding protein